MNYVFQEKIEARYLRFIKPEFIVDANISIEAIFIRVLLGTLRLTNNLSTDSFDQTLNYSLLGRPNNSIVSTKIIKECVEPESNLSLLCQHLTRTKYTNISFFENLVEEICSYFYKRTLGSHTTGFLHLYRALEFISYSFPLIYASIDNNYYGSFEKFKNYFDTSKSELLFFEAFLQKLLNTNYLDTNFTINFNTLNQNVDKNHYLILKEYLGKDKDGNDNIISDVQYVSITTQYKHLFRLVIELRNRYFHFAMGGKRNIKPSEIIENDIFFSLINEEIMNWIAVIYFEILKIVSNR